MGFVFVGIVKLGFLYYFVVIFDDGDLVVGFDFDCGLNEV